MKVEKTELSIKIDFSEMDLLILADGLIDPFAWVETLVSEKLANCESLLKSVWLGKLQADKTVDNIPTKDDEFIDLIFNSPDYKNRADREKPVM